jgi:hypothetical protein
LGGHVLHQPTQFIAEHVHHGMITKDLPFGLSDTVCIFPSLMYVTS